MRLPTVSLGLLALNLGLVGCWSNKDVVARDNAGGTTSLPIGTTGGQQTRVSSLTTATVMGGAHATGGATTFSGGTSSTFVTTPSGGVAGIGGYASGGLSNTGGQLTNTAGSPSSVAAGGSNFGGIPGLPTGGTPVTGGNSASGARPSTTGTTTPIGTLPTGGTTGAAGGSSTAPTVDERPNPPCETVEDCKLVSDCCTCDVYAATAQGPSCNIQECKASQCELKSLDASDITCIGGRCTFLRSCDSQLVTCPQPPPSCPAGQLPMVESDCYSGDCTTVTSCRDVSSCDTCTAQGLSCATWHEMFALTYHCVNTPLNCNDTTNCECMGVCAFGYICNHVPDQLLACVCPGC
jgi:hypothetical protein